MLENNTQKGYIVPGDLPMKHEVGKIDTYSDKKLGVEEKKVFYQRVLLPCNILYWERNGFLCIIERTEFFRTWHVLCA